MFETLRDDSTPGATPGLFSRMRTTPSRRDFLTVSGAVAAMAMIGCGDDNNNNGPVITLPLTSDTDILRFALFLELLEAEFYNQAVAKNILTGNVQSLAQLVRDHENQHVDALRGALGSSNDIDDSDVEFNFGTALDNQGTFLSTALTLEQTGVGAYLGALPLITDRTTRRTAGSIFTIEARHTAAFRAYTGNGTPVPNAFESPMTADAVVSAVRGTGFVTKGL